MMGQPIKGDADILSQISAADLAQFKAANYFGDNIVVVGTGNISHEQFVDQVN
jgi:predicted Zn-dependent peptidase